MTPAAPPRTRDGGVVALLLFTGVLTALFVRLGVWQWHRGQLREAEHAQFARGAATLVPLAGATAALPLYQRVSASGRLDAAHQFLLDNRPLRGQAGYEVLTPLVRDGSPVLLVDRGWVPFTGSRARLPDVGVGSAGAVTLEGRLAPLPAAGLALGHAAPPPGPAWPKVTSFPTPPELEAALGTPLEARILLLDPGFPDGYVRDWQPVGPSPLRHYAYAVQWWCFAALAPLALLLARRRTRGAP